ncbi:hypothetical protein BU17DRAFT_63490 [Hysterangium stoloniferum]|nr:hypothetical protein BU17DRAFT_63490 [Hysterangium stoloniferum]
MGNILACFGSRQCASQLITWLSQDDDGIFPSQIASPQLIRDGQRPVPENMRECNRLDGMRENLPLHTLSSQFNFIQLPQELVDEIVDYISSDRLMLLVCNRISHISMSPKTGNKLSQIIQNDPYIHAFVKKLTIDENGGRRSHPSIASAIPIQIVAPRLTNVLVLCLDLVDLIIAHPKIMEFDLWHVVVQDRFDRPHDIVTRMLSVPPVELSGGSKPRWRLENPPLQITVPRLDPTPSNVSFHILTCTSSLPAFSRVIDIIQSSMSIQIHKLIVSNLCRDDGPLLSAILTKLASSLKHLELTLSGACNKTEAEVYSPVISGLASIPIVLASISSPHLESISFRLYGQPTTDHPINGLDSLDKVLSRPNFRHLRKVAFEMYGNMTMSKSGVEIQKGMPMLCERAHRGFLTLDVGE